MIKIKEGFKGGRVVSLPEELLSSYLSEPLIANLYVRKIGFFPHARYHYVQKDSGCDYSMLIYCTDGSGWYRIADRTYTIEKNQYVILPPDTPYSFGASDDEPWTIYWLHFKGNLQRQFVRGGNAPHTIEPGDYSRLQDRMNMFEEIYSRFSMGFIKEYMVYSSLCLYNFLASFVFLEQYRHSRQPAQKEYPFIERVIHYMQENIHSNITLKELSAYFRYSPSHFSALFSRKTGFSPIDYFIRMKIQKACEYIELTSMKLNEIAVLLGFEEASYFTRTFTKVMGQSPSAYREKESDLEPTVKSDIQTKK